MPLMLIETVLAIVTLLAILMATLCVAMVYRMRSGSSVISPVLDQRLVAIEASITRSDSLVRDEFARGRDESREGARSLREEITTLFGSLATSVRGSLADLATGQNTRLEDFAGRLNEAKTTAAVDAKALREEIQATLQRLGDNIGTRIGDLVTAQGEKLDTVTTQIGTLTEGNERRQEALRTTVETKLVELKTDLSASAKALREEVAQSLQTLGGTLVQTLDQISQAQRERLDRVSGVITELTQKSGQQQEALRMTVEQRLDVIRTENTEKLEGIRQTVDEKLQSTLNERLGASFQVVSEWLERVHKSMGEMQGLANGVGDLKRLLTNVKSRGTWGEVALGNLLEEVMSPDQFGRNVEIVPGSNQRVEYAIRLPGDGNTPVWLPLDSKFPSEDYERLEDARQRGDIEAVEIAARAIETAIRLAARDISSKYIHSPHSTDFAVLFLPTEGLFAEVIRRPGLVDALQRDCHIMVAGPTNLVSLLVAFRMGFRSLAIQQRSGEVWTVLSAVKTEFGKFGHMLDKVSRKLRDAQTIVDEEAGVRRRAIDRKLRGLEVLPEIEAAAVLELDQVEELDADQEAREAAE
jgi:DNA recombination protein RmuC